MTPRIVGPRLPLSGTLFYALERAIKAYRRFAQARIAATGTPITIDQWLVLRTLRENPEASQRAVADAVFKDVASLSRIVHALRGRRLLRRTHHVRDARRSKLALTAAGRRVVRALEPIIAENRRRALRGVTPADVQRARLVLRRIFTNCHGGDDQ